MVDRRPADGSKSANLPPRGFGHTRIRSGAPPKRQEKQPFQAFLPAGPCPAGKNQRNALVPPYTAPEPGPLGGLPNLPLPLVAQKGTFRSLPGARTFCSNQPFRASCRVLRTAPTPANSATKYCSILSASTVWVRSVPKMEALARMAFSWPW